MSKPHICPDPESFREIEASYAEEINPPAVELIVHCRRCGKRYEYWVPASGFKLVEST